ncbi:MAG: hypothetical protein ABL940_10745, partial [Bacteroidia bacterium]
MKNTFVLLLSISILFLVSNCTNSKKETIIKKTTEHELPLIKNDSILEKQKVVIYDDGVRLSYSKNELNKIEILFPVFKNDYFIKPAEAYRLGIWKEYIDEKGEKETFSFGSEAGQDDFYLLYAYYIKQQNGIEKYKTERATLIKLYQAINGIYWKLNCGGTYFGHQHKRLVADAEYSIYDLRFNSLNYIKKYSYEKQKENYLHSLRQYI